MAEKLIKALIIEDDTDYASLLQIKLKRGRIGRFDSHIAGSLGKALELVKKNAFDVILLDLTLPDSIGLDSLKTIQASQPHVPIIVLTGLDDESIALEAVRQGVQDYLIKGHADDRLLERVIKYAIERKRVEEVLWRQKEEQKIIFNSVQAMIWYKDKKNNILRVNKAAADSLGLTIEEVEGKNTKEFYPEEADKYLEDDLEVVNSGKPKYGIIEQYQISGGEKRWVRTDKIPYRDKKGKIIGVIVFAIDVTERKQVEDTLRESEARLREQSNVLIDLAKNKSIGTENFNATLNQITEVAAETLKVARVSIWFYRNDRSKIYCADLHEAGSQKHLSGMEIAAEKYPIYFHALEKNRCITAHHAHTDPRTKEFAEDYFYSQGISSVMDAPIRLRGKTIGVICHEHVGPPRKWTIDEQNFVASLADFVALAMESAERKRAEQRLNRLAYYDPMTDLPNRVLFIDRLNQAIIGANKYNRLVAVLFLDLDHFKRINDTLGHAAGDEMLKAVAVRLKKTLFETDTLTRIGGDEFTVMLPGLEKADHAIRVAEKVFASFKQPFHISGQALYMTVSMGIAIFPNDGVDSATILKNADTAMYQAKDKGRNNYRMYSSAMSVRAFECLILENSLRRSLDNNELEVYYQPLIDSQSGKIIKLEALVRWHHPNLGLVGPNEFIPIAEETGIIVPLGEWVMKQACWQVKEWHEKGYSDLRVAVNLSDRQFNYGDLVGVVSRILTETRLEPRFLDLELTENMIMKNIDDSIRTQYRLKMMGVTISIDDFGTGYSSLSYLKRFPIDTLKIDRSFINDVHKDKSDEAIIKAIISMAHNMKLSVVAEGVETDQQLQFLKLHDCDILQGFLFSKPLPAINVEKLFVIDSDSTGNESVA